MTVSSYRQKKGVEEQSSCIGCYRDVARELSEYCASNAWSGYDPYDALNARLFDVLPCVDRRFFRLAITQLFKRSPIDLRTFARVPRTANPKALALFLTAFIRMSKAGLDSHPGTIEYLICKLAELRSAWTPQWSWGYSFPWQGRRYYVPRGYPNLVCTSFVANALLDAFEHTSNSEYLSMAVSAAEYVRDELYWTEGPKAGFGYPLPQVRTPVHNANLLGAALLARVGRLSGGELWMVPALRVARYSATQQDADGAWKYGEEPSQRWIDNFHTGYNLCALKSLSDYCSTAEFNTYIHRGFEFFLSNFIRSDGAPRYYADRTYPIDVHCAAQTIITLVACRNLDSRSLIMARGVLDWTIKNMWDTRRKYFYYQLLPYYTCKISYMRWSQAWMLLAIVSFLEHTSTSCGTQDTSRSK